MGAKDLEQRKKNMSHEKSDKPSYSEKGIAARLSKLHSGKTTYIVVEGESDMEFWNTITESEVEVLPAHGRSAVIEGVRKFPKISVGVVDDDYEQIRENNENLNDTNLFSTKEPNDIESLLFQSWMEGGEDCIYLRTRGKIHRIIPIRRQVVKKAVSVSRRVGILRAVNHIEGWGLRFNSDSSFIPSWLEEFVNYKGIERVRILIEGVKRNSVQIKPSAGEIISRYEQAEREFHDFSDYSLTNGHDLSKTIQILTGGVVTSKEIEKWLRREVKPRASFDLFKNMNAWSKKTGRPLIRVN